LEQSSRAVLAETESRSRRFCANNRRLGLVSGSAHAITPRRADSRLQCFRSQLPHLALRRRTSFSWVSTKDSPNLQDAFDRIKTYVVPLEDARMKAALGYGTALIRRSFSTVSIQLWVVRCISSSSTRSSASSLFDLN